MKTICIETHVDSAIWWWIRLPEDRIIYSTQANTERDLVRAMNLQRFNIDVRTLNPDEYSSIIWNDNINIQIWSNNWSLSIPWLYPTPKTHPILSKAGLIWLIQNTTWLDKYIPKSAIISRNDTHKEASLIHNIQKSIADNFSIHSKIAIKNAIMDGNGNWVWFIDYDDKPSLTTWLQKLIDKFTMKAWGKVEKVLYSDYVIQEFIDNKIWEWSISFSIQNNTIETRWLANNTVWDWEFFGSTNYHPYLEKSEYDTLQDTLSKDLLPLLQSLQKEWVRGNVWFDILYQRANGNIKAYILESNWIYRTTGSTLPNCFGYNTKNDFFIGIPIIPKYINSDYMPLTPWTLLTLSKHLMALWTTPGEAQIMNIKSEWINLWYPVLWIAGAWPTIKEIQDLYLHAWLLNNAGKEYIKKIFATMKKQS